MINIKTITMCISWFISTNQPIHTIHNPILLKQEIAKSDNAYQNAQMQAIIDDFIKNLQQSILENRLVDFVKSLNELVLRLIEELSTLSKTDIAKCNQIFQAGNTKFQLSALATDMKQATPQTQIEQIIFPHLSHLIQNTLRMVTEIEYLSAEQQPDYEDVVARGLSKLADEALATPRIKGKKAFDAIFDED